MAITQAVCNSFKVEILKGLHNFTATTGNTFKLALYDNEATLSKSTTAFQQTDEVGASGTYAAGGGALVNAGTSMTAGVARADFANLSFTGVTLTARGALIYNTTTGSGSSTTDAVCVLDFGGDKTATSGTFTIQFPAATSTAALLRISG